MSQRKADITLLLEGTYPYIRGGVSSWVHQIIQGLPYFTFALVFLGSKASDYQGRKYPLPENVVHLETHYLWEEAAMPKPMACAGNRQFFSAIEKLQEWFRDSSIEYEEKPIQQVLIGLGQKSGCTLEDFLFSEAAWEKICADYQRYCADGSFIDYFRTVRSMHLPLFKLAAIAHQIPATGVFHAISTGYAGFLGALSRSLTGRPLILTEHGIYTKERKIDIQSAFIDSNLNYLNESLDRGMKYHDRLWISFFESLGRLIYRNSMPIISLYESNRQRQIADGASPGNTLVIPNGLRVEPFVPLREVRPKDTPFVIGFLGRIVPVKDIKTFIRAMRTVVTRLPQAECWVVGPDEEDPEYVQECKSLVYNLGLERNLRFLGYQKPSEILPKLGVLVLTSITEAFPLVLLEAFACGVPVVATDVGACREVIEGVGEADRALGAAGIVVPIAEPESTANAVLKLMTDKSFWLAAQRAGTARVERFYTEEKMLSTYHGIYVKALRS
jgi:glycosyltransferase involved in cell wall biosynthesis